MSSLFSTRAHLIRRNTLLAIALIAGLALAFQFTIGQSAVTPGTPVTASTQTKTLALSPGAVSANDLLVAQIVMVPGDVAGLPFACAPSTGLTWTRIARTTSGTEVAMETWWARATAAASAPSYSFTIRTADSCGGAEVGANEKATVGGIQKFTGVVTTVNPINISAAASSSGAVTTLNAPTATTTYADTRVLRYFGWASAGTISASDTASYNINATNKGNRSAAAFDNGTQTAAGATGTYAGTGTSGAAVAQTIALIPAPNLVFTTAARAGTVNVCISDPMQVQFRNDSGNAANNLTGSAVSVSLSSSQSGTFYSDSSCTTSITSTSVANGASTSSNFYYKGTATGGGIHTVTASALGASTTQDQSVKANQTITFTQPTSPAGYGSTFTVSPTSTSNLSVSVAASGGCTISGSTVTMTSSTVSCVLTASQAGNVEYFAATDLQRTVAATTSNQTITFSQPSTPVAYDATFTVTPTASSNLSVSVNVSGGCQIDGSSGGTTTIRMTSPSVSCVVTASQSGDSNYSAASDVSRTVAATKANQTVTFNQPTTTPAIGQPSTSAQYDSSFSLSAASSSGLTVSFSVSGGCSLSGTTVEMTSPSTSCVITASQAGNSNYNAATNVVRTVTATKANQSITFAQPATPAAYDSTFSVSPTASSNLTVAVSVSGGCTIASSSGGSTTIRMTSASTACSITAAQSGDTFYFAASNEARTVNAKKANQATLSVTGPGSVDYNSTGTLTSTGGSGTGNVTYSAGSSTGCSVSGTTLSVSNASGTCAVTATRAADANYEETTSASYTVTLVKDSQTISFTSTLPGSLQTGDTYRPTATATSGLTVTFSTANPSICSYASGTGLVTMIARGTCVVRADQSGNSNYTAAPQTSQSFGVGLANQVPIYVTGPLSASIGSPGTLTYTGGTTGLPVIYAAGSSTGCSVSGTTLTVTNGTGTCFVTVTMPGNESYADVTSDVFPVSLGRLPQNGLNIVSPVSLTYGSTVAVTWNGGTTNGSVSLSTGSSTGCSLSGVMLSVTNASGTCVVTATMAGNGSYNAVVSAPWTVELVKKEQLLLISSKPAEGIGIGGVYVPELSYGGSTSPVVIIANGACEYGFGVVRMKSAGTCNVIVSQEGDANHQAAVPFLQTFEVSASTDTGPIRPTPEDLPFRSFIPGIVRS